MAQDQWTLQEKGQKVNRRTGRHCRPVLYLPTGQSLQLATIPAHMEMNRGVGGDAMRRGPPLQTHVVAANGTVLTTCDDPGAHGNEQGRAKQNRTGAGNVEGSRHGMAKVASKQSRQNGAAAGKHSRQMI